MKGIILGSGTGVPSLRRNAPGYWLEIKGHQFLVDCGSGILLQLERVGKSFQNLDAIFITHTHADHIGDLIPFVHALRLPGMHRDKPLTLYGPPGFVEFFERIVVPVSAPPTDFPFRVQEVAPIQALDGVLLKSCATPHSDRFACRAYRFEYQGLSVVFSGDTDFHPDLVTFCRAADVLFLECSSLDAGKVDGHLSAGLCGKIAEMAGVKRLILTHFYPIDGPDSLFFDECRSHFSGVLELAIDLNSFAVETNLP
ncbi:MAG: MBL fold metallo-hydrolase [Magnetococcus sp. YQC-5]